MLKEHCKCGTCDNTTDRKDMLVTLTAKEYKILNKLAREKQLHPQKIMCRALEIYNFTERRGVDLDEWCSTEEDYTLIHNR